MRERSSSESSWVDKGERAESPVFYPKRPSNNWAKSFLSNDTISQIASKEPVVPSIKIKLHMPSMSKPHLSIKGQPGPDDKTLWVRYLAWNSNHFSSTLAASASTFTNRIHPEELSLVRFLNRLCSKCGMSFIGTWYDRQRKRPSCPSCWGMAANVCSKSHLEEWE